MQFNEELFDRLLADARRLVAENKPFPEPLDLAVSINPRDDLSVSWEVRLLPIDVEPPTGIWVKTAIQESASVGEIREALEVAMRCVQGLFWCND